MDATFADYLSTNPTVFVLFGGAIGLLVGSFLNVVIHRLPIMMERDWKAQCRELVAADAEPAEALPSFNLCTPGSHCPGCEHSIRAYENIPVISYLMLRGKCSNCGVKISSRYPIVEVVTALLSAATVWHFGFGWAAAAALLLTWALIALTMIDFDHHLLPDTITLPLLWLGLILSVPALFVDAHTSILGAAAGYLSLWSIYWLFKLLTGKEGMGYGDFKLLAVLGAWLGWQGLPVVILMSSLVGAVVGITLIIARGRDRNIPIPFGPYLAVAGWITLLWGEEISLIYLQYVGLA